jgi:RNA polymerase sigma-70 factor (ECF subfamily)
MTLTPDLRDSILLSIPRMRAFAISLTGNVDQADDLVQEAMVRGLTYIEQFQPGTNIEAWLFTILRNQFHTMYRKRRREVEDPDGSIAARLSVLPEQDGYLAVQDLKAALSHLAVEQREALLLVAAQGFSYEEAADICGTRMARSRAGFIALVQNLLNYSGLRTQRTSEQTASSKPVCVSRNALGASGWAV